MDLKAGTVLREGQYVIEEILGEGAFGITYRATDTELSLSVAIKTLNQTLRHHPDFEKFQKQFIASALVLRQCQHPHIVRVFDCFHDDGIYYIVMEYVPGQTLAEIVQSGEALPETKAVKYIRQVSAALHALHQAGILHRDIKPQNIIRRKESDSIVLTDMGIAWELTPGIAQTYASLLSAGFAAVEQYIAEAPRTPATDIYSLAATFYYLLTGIPPVAAPLRDRLPLAEWRKIQPKLSPGVARAICEGLQVEAQRRPQSVRAWLSVMLSDKQAVKKQEPDSRLKPASQEKSPQAETSHADAAKAIEQPAPAARSQEAAPATGAETGLAQPSQRVRTEQPAASKPALAKKTQQSKKKKPASRQVRAVASAQPASQFKEEAIAEKPAPAAETRQVEARGLSAANPQSGELAPLPLLSAKTPLPKKARERKTAQPQALESSPTETPPERQGRDRQNSQPVQPFNIELLKAQPPLESSKTPLQKAPPAQQLAAASAPENPSLPAAEDSKVEQEEPPEQPTEPEKIAKERAIAHFLQWVPTRQWLTRAFLLTAAFGAFIGAGFGFAVRFVIAGKSGSSLFHAEQSFPPSKNWPGTVPFQGFSNVSETDSDSPSLQLPEWLSHPLPEAQNLPVESNLNAQPEPPASTDSAIEPQSEPAAPDSSQTDAGDAAPESETLPQPELGAAQTPETPSESAPYNSPPDPKPDDWVSLPESSFVPGSGIR